MTSPGPTRVGCWMACPLTIVPLRDPRSSTKISAPVRKNRECRREANGSESVTSASSARPTTSESPRRGCSNGAPSAGVIWRRRGASTIMSLQLERLAPLERAPLAPELLDVGNLLVHPGELIQPVLSGFGAVSPQGLDILRGYRDIPFEIE